MDNLYALLPEDPLEVEILGIETAPHFAGTVVLNTWPAGSAPAVSKVELMAIAPWSALLDIRSLVVHMTGRQVILDHSGNGAALDESRQNLNR